MSEASDDAQVAAKGEAPPGALEPNADHDDVEVVAQAEEPEPPRHDSVSPRHDSVSPRHDSVNPGSRRLAPPPKPKRDSSHPASIPPPPEPPLISYQDASGAVKPGTGLAEELNQEAGAFTAREAPSGTKPMAPRPRSRVPSMSSVSEGKPAGSEPPMSVAPETRPSEGVMLPGPPPVSRDKLPTLPDEPLRTPSAPPKSGGIFAQRIIAVGTPSRPPPASASFEPTLSQPAAPPPPPPAVMEVPPPPIAAVAPAAEGPFAAPPAPPPPPSASPSAPDLSRTLDSAPELQRPPVAPMRSAGPPPPPPPPVELSPNGPATPPRGAFLEEAPPRIPSAADLEDEEPTAPNASVEPLMAPAPVIAAPLIPAEPTPPPPIVDAPRAAEALAVDDVAPDSADRIAVEELSREDSPSLPPDEPTPLAPPPAPSARSDAKQPPPPPKRAPAPTAASSAESDKKKEKAKQKRAWWEELFSEDFVRANWKVSEAQIKREVTFVEESLGVAPGGVVLDLGCGAGQHAVELASRGYGVVGYDLSLYQLALAADIAQERSQKLNFLQGDMREMAFEEMFDGIFCWNTSFGYFEEDKNYSVAERTFRALRPGGMFLIDVMNRDFVAAHTPSSVWFEGDACVCMDDATIDYFTSRLRVKRSVILDDGRTRECTYSVRLYSFHELGKLLHDVGFRVTEVSGHPSTPGVFLGQASPRILMLAQRP